MLKHVVILSDTHGNIAQIAKLQDTMDRCSCIIHLGDRHTDMSVFYERYKDKLIVIQGNCDTVPAATTQVLSLGTHRCFATHGHLYGVKKGIDDLVLAAQEAHCDTVLYGHTHIAKDCTVSGIRLINPGSLSYPKFGAAGYAYLSVHESNLLVKLVKI